MKSAVETCGQDTGALDSVIRFVRRLLVNDGGQLRSRASVLKKVEDYKENFAALRKVANNHKAVLRAGGAALRGLCAKPLPPGAIEKIARLARSIDLGAAAKIGPGSESYDIHKAVFEYARAFDRIVRETGLDKIWDGQDDYAQGRLRRHRGRRGRIRPRKRPRPRATRRGNPRRKLCGRRQQQRRLRQFRHELNRSPPRRARHRARRGAGLNLFNLEQVAKSSSRQVVSRRGGVRTPPRRGPPA